MYTYVCTCEFMYLEQPIRSNLGAKSLPPYRLFIHTALQAWLHKLLQLVIFLRTM